jgi:hypothetical protein
MKVKALFPSNSNCSEATVCYIDHLVSHWSTIIVLFMAIYRGRKFGSDECKDDLCNRLPFGRRYRGDLALLTFSVLHLYSPKDWGSLKIPQKAIPMCPEAAADHVVTCHPC